MVREFNTYTGFGTECVEFPFVKNLCIPLQQFYKSSERVSIIAS